MHLAAYLGVEIKFDFPPVVKVSPIGLYSKSHVSESHEPGYSRCFSFCMLLVLLCCVGV